MAERIVLCFQRAREGDQHVDFRNTNTRVVVDANARATHAHTHTHVHLLGEHRGLSALHGVVVEAVNLDLADAADPGVDLDVGGGALALGARLLRDLLERNLLLALLPVAEYNTKRRRCRGGETSAGVS